MEIESKTADHQQIETDRLGNRNKVGAAAATRHDLVGDAVVGNAEMLMGFLERRIDDGIFDQISHALAHGARWRDQARF